MKVEFVYYEQKISYIFSEIFKQILHFITIAKTEKHKTNKTKEATKQAFTKAINHETKTEEARKKKL